MKKIPTIFKRDPENMRNLLQEHHPDCEWVFAGEGVATRKYDGTCCLVRDGKLYKRREVKKGKPYPDNFDLVDQDVVTGKAVGWVPVTDEKEDRWHREALGGGRYIKDGTYELCGPKINGNPEGFFSHIFVPHYMAEINKDIEDRTFEGLKEFLADRDIEGLVFHHLDGRMAKIKKRDYGMKRK